MVMKYNIFGEWSLNKLFCYNFLGNLNVLLRWSTYGMESDIHASTKKNKYEAYRITNLGSMTSSLKNGSFMFMEVLSSFYLRFKENLLKKLITKIMLQIQHTKCYNNKFTNKRLSYSAENKLEVLEKILWPRQKFISHLYTCEQCPFCRSMNSHVLSSQKNHPVHDECYNINKSWIYLLGNV